MQLSGDVLFFNHDSTEDIVSVTGQSPYFATGCLLCSCPFLFFKVLMSLLQMHKNNMEGQTRDYESLLDPRCFETVIRTGGVQGVLNLKIRSIRLTQMPDGWQLFSGVTGI